MKPGLVTHLSTSALSDALDSFGLLGGLGGVRAHGGASICGPAFTVARVRNDDPARCAAADFIDRVPAGAVIVIDNLGVVDSTCWGALLSTCALRRGVQGTVIHGVHRDADPIRELGYPVFSRGTYMVTGKGRMRLKAIQVELEIDGVTVRPGDLVVGDADGVVVVPRARAGDVIARAERIERVEREIAALVAGGVPLREARARLGYHELSRRAS